MCGSTRHRAVQSPKNAYLLGLGRRPDDDRRCVGIPRIRRDRLVGGRPWAPCGRSLHRSSSTAPCQQHRGWKLWSVRRQLGRGSAFPKPMRLGGTLAPRFKPGFRLMYAALGITAKRFRRAYVEQLRKTLNDYDRQILLRPEVETAFAETSAECFAQGSDGLVRDSECLYRRWAFDVTKIERPVHMWQGTDDRLVPASINKTVADRMPGAVWHSVEGAGHFVAVGSADQVFAIAARRNWGCRWRSRDPAVSNPRSGETESVGR